MPLEGIPVPADDAEYGRLLRTLTDLYSGELAIDPDNLYLRDHAAPGWIADHVRTFLWYWPFVAGATDLLDWGCQHAPDGALVRACSESTVVWGCDVQPAGRYPAFWKFVDLQYRELGHYADLPFDDCSFDAIVAGGVLEHVPSDWASVRELYRVLRPGGKLVITYLPNWLSLHEYQLRRAANARGAHDRRYRRREVARLLLHSGFRPVTPILYQTFAWQRQAERLLGRGSAADRVAGLLRGVAPVHVVRASTFCVVAEKVAFMD